ncbi:MAG: NADH-quinone oxidoreductase subunit NuoG [Janthinobacterium lividum]
MAIIHIDGKEFEAKADTNLLQACLSAGSDLPYFCWHPELGSVGACRQCAVKQFSGPDDTRGRIVMACMTPVTEGARLSIKDEEAADFRSSVVEWLMTNHPHDCPVCEEGGECHLQDMTVMTGHKNRRYRFTKRTHRNQDLGPFVKHEMNRCIACYRCVRFYRDYAGGQDLAAFASNNSVFFGRHESGTLESDFSGNLVEVCPTGVFTDKPFSANYARKWDMRGAPSVCVHCAVGCNTMVNERAGIVRRVLNRYNGEVNRYFLCDRGRFGYGFVNAAGRVRTPLLRDASGVLQPVDAAEAVQRFADALREGQVIGIGSPRASLEANFALQTLVGRAHFHFGVSDLEQTLLETTLDILRAHPAAIATLQQAEQSDAVLVLGEDVCKTAPRLGLALRQSVRQASFEAANDAKVPLWLDAAVRTLGDDVLSPLFQVTPASTDLDPVSTLCVHLAPDDIARLGAAIAHRIDPEARAAPALPDALAQQADLIAGALLAAKRPLIVSGTQCGSQAMLNATADIARALHRTRPDTRLVLTMPECNSMGLAMLGGQRLDSAIEALDSGDARTVIVLENDLSRRMPDERLTGALRTAARVIVLDHLQSATSGLADLVLPAASFAETDGTLVSNEGRAQRFFQASYPAAPIQDSWRWLRDAARAAGRNEDFSWANLDDVIAALGVAHPALAAVRDAAPGATFRINGARIRSETHRFSGRTASQADISVRDRMPETNPDAPLSSTMEGFYGDMPAALRPFYWAPSWNSVQSLNKFQEEVGGPLQGGDPGIRLLDASPVAGAYHPVIPVAFVARDNELLVLPAGRLFGSEELSDRSPSCASRIAPPSLSVSPAMHARLGDTIRLTLDGTGHAVAVTTDPSLPDGVARYPAHAAPFAAFDAPQWAAITPGAA